MTYKEFVENFENIFRKFEKLAHEETIQYWNGLTTEEKLEVISYVTTPSKDIYDIEKYKPLEELKKELKRFEDLGAVVDFISDLDNTEIYIYKLINNARKFTNSFNKDYIDDIEKNIIDLRKTINLRSQSQSCWKEILSVEISNNFSFAEREQIWLMINEIIKKNHNTKEEYLYKEIYNEIIVLKIHFTGNLYKKLIDNIQKKYINIWDWAYKFHKYDKDEEYYKLFCECKNKIAEYVNTEKHFDLKNSEVKENIIEAINKYVSFLYIVYSKRKDTKNWNAILKHIIEDKKSITNIANLSQEKIKKIEIIRDNENAISFKSKKVIGFICNAITGPVSSKILFDVRDNEDSKDIEPKQNLFISLEKRGTFLNTMIYGIETAFYECGVNCEIDNDLNIFIYELIHILTPDAYNTKQQNLPLQESKNYIKSKRGKTRRENIDKILCNLTYSIKENKNPFFVIYEPNLCYTEKTNTTKNDYYISSFSDVFWEN